MSSSDQAPRAEALSGRDKRPDSIGPYRVLGLLGEGGMGVVYLAEHKQTRERVALKTVSVPKRVRLQGIRAEILALRRLNHAQIVRIKDHGVTPGEGPWYAMELLEGKTFADWLVEIWPSWTLSPRTTDVATSSDVSADAAEERISAPEPAVRPIGLAQSLHALSSRPPAGNGHLVEIMQRFRRLCEPLAYLHGRGIVHRDVKPSNVFIREDGCPILMDFGLTSRARGAVGREALDPAGLLAGTVTYLSPEQARREAIDARTDLYALGCMLYESVTGLAPFRAAYQDQLLAQHLWEPPVPPSSLVDGVDPRLERLILGLLAKERRNRIGHADDVARVLAEVEGTADAVASITEAPAYLYRPEVAGREEVLREFDGLLDGLQSKQGAFVFLTGESGIGKTFLATDVARRAAIRGLRVVTAECAHPGAQADTMGTIERRGLPLQPLRPLLTAVADFCSEEAGTGRVERLFGARAKIIAEHVPTLASLPGQEQHAGPTDLPAEEAHRLLVQSVLEVLAAYAAEGPPLLWLIDDLQWADELSLKILAALEPAWLGEKGVMILCTYRSDEAGKELRGLVAKSGARSIDIARMEPEAVGRIAADMLAVRSVPETVISFLSAQTEGVPFFVAEYLRAAVADGLLIRKAGYWRFRDAEQSDADLKALSLPKTIHELMLTRLARVEGELRGLVDLASVIGRAADVETLARITDPEADAAGFDHTLARVRELVRLQILESPEMGRYRFVHDKLRQTAYDAVPPETRVALHREVARLLEEKLRDRKETPPYGELAHHFTQGKLWDKAIDYLEKAGQQAFASFAHKEAIGFFKSAVGLADKASVGITRLRLACWERHLVDSHLALGDMESAHGHAERALEHCGFRLPSTRAGWFMGFLGQVVLRVVERVVPGPFRVRSPERRSLVNEAAYVLNRLCEPFFLAHKPLEGFYCGLRDLNLAERVPASEALARGYATLAMVVGAGPFGKLGRVWSGRAIQIARSLGLPGAVTYCTARAGVVLGSLADWTGALESIAVAESIARTRSDLRQLGETICIKGLILGFRGDFAGSLAAASELIRIGTSRGDSQLVRWGRNLSVHAVTRLGRSRDAMPVVTQMMGDHARAHVGEAEKVFDLGGFALTHLARGELSEARERAADVLAGIRKERFLPYFLKTGLDAACEVQLALLERADSAVPQGSALRSDARELVRRLRKFASLYPMARPRALIYEGWFSWLIGRRQRALATWTSAVGLARSYGVPYDEGRAHLELGRHLRPGEAVAGADREGHLAAAAALLEAAGAILELGRLEDPMATLALRPGSAR